MTRWDMPGGRVSSITPSCAASLVASMILPGVSSGTVREPMRRAKRYWSASPIDTDLISSDPHSGIYGASGHLGVPPLGDRTAFAHVA